MKLNNSEKTLLGIFFLLSSIVILYNLFYIPSLPSADIIKKEFVFQEEEEEKNKKDSERININNASLDELKKIPGVGESTAQKIIDYREQNGGFLYTSEIINVNGISEKKFNAMKDYITIGD